MNRVNGKTCPFCGNLAKTIPIDYMWKVVCDECGSSTDLFDTEEAAIEIWEHRVDEERFSHIAMLLAESHPGYCEFCIAFGEEFCSGNNLRGADRKSYCTSVMVGVAARMVGGGNVIGG